MFKKVNPKQSFPKLEEDILNFWKENNIFEKSIKNRENSKEFNFYDGPPFATGTPHYGHILAGTIKDVIPRYWTMKGFKVDRKFGWDCHGLPIENIVEKKLGVSGKDDIEKKLGVHEFNEECRRNVFTYAKEWEKTVERMGRWVDMKNDYKTMDTNFMESVWWVYKTIYDKGLIYEGNRVVPYCARCTTPLSNFEVNLGYKDKQDKTLTVKFKIIGNENKYILAWTTTPWTLMANLGLAVGEDIMYSEIKDNKSGETYILASERIKEYYKKEEEYNIVREYKGSCLEGIKYEPIFDDFKIKLGELNEDLGQNIFLGENSYKIVLGHHVTTESGTGIVHIAPAYGEDDFIIGKEKDLGFVSHINDSGKTYNTLDDNEKYVFEYNNEVIEKLKKRGDTIKISTIDHSYPHCWRCEEPLIYRGISAWYVAVEKIREKMIKNNQEINWNPEIIKNGRFGKWISQARDWNISRNRYWGSAIPVWQNEDKTNEICIGSIEEMYKLNKPYGDITKIILVRHAETDYNIENKLDSLNKAKISDLGIKQAKKITEELKNQKIDKIYSSPLSRCIETIKELAEEKNVEIIKSEEITERDFGNYNGKKYNEEIANLYENKNEKTGETGESINSLEKRVEDFYKNLIEENKGKTIVICSHGDIIGKIKFLIEKKTFNRENFEEFYKSMNGQKRYIEKYIYNETKTEVDIHKHFVDKINLKDPKTGEKLTRVSEVLDCWFESGSMPYASKHYPFKNNKNFKFPADFIAEGLDQTRGWFYTLLILGSALFDKAPMKNVIVNGIVLAEDGQKMSKSKKNYPDPQIVFDKYGADAMRFYLMNSPVVEAQDFRFTESGVEEVVKKVILPLWNTYYFFTTYANIDKFEAKGLKNPENNLDKWLLSELNELIKNVSEGFDEYKLNNSAKPIVKFMDNLTNWYIRRSRKRFWKSDQDGDKIKAYETLYFTLVELTKIIAPFMPFVSENIYKNLTNEKSVHLSDFPEYKENIIDNKLNTETDKVQKIITLGLAWRANQKIRVRQPLNSITITEELDKYYHEIIKEELNVKNVIVVDGTKIAKKICKPNGRKIGPKFGRNVKFIMSEAKSGNFEEMDNLGVKVGDFELEKGDFELVFESENTKALIESGFGMVIEMDPNINNDLKNEGYARDIVRQIQETRKEANYNVDDRIKIYIGGADEIIKGFKEYIESETLSEIKGKLNEFDLKKDIEIEELKIEIKLKK